MKIYQMVTELSGLQDFFENKTKQKTNKQKTNKQTQQLLKNKRAQLGSHERGPTILARNTSLPKTFL